MGDIAQAEAYLRRSQPADSGGAHQRPSRHGERPTIPSARTGKRRSRLGRAMIFEARGQFREAEASYRLGRAAQARRHQGDFWSSENPPAETVLLAGVDATILSQARMKARQGRLAEAEVDARRALLSRLKDQGKYNPVDPALHHGAGRHPGRTGPLRRSRAARAGVPRDQPTVGVADDSRLDRAGAVAARRHPEPAAQGPGGDRGLCARSTRPSPTGSRRGARSSNSTARASSRSMRRARSRPASRRRSSS